MTAARADHGLPPLAAGAFAAGAEPVADDHGLLTPQELLAGGALVHEVMVPFAVLQPQAEGPAVLPDAAPARRVRLKPLKVGTLALIAKAARDDASLVPLLMVKESLVAPAMGIEQVRQLHAGLVQYLVAAIHRISGLDADGNALSAAASSPIGEAHLLLARHYGWTPQQVAELTPGQMAVYLAGLTGAAPGDAGAPDGQAADALPGQRMWP